MTFSEEFKISLTSADDWFDPILALDTKLFIDPFLVFQSSKKDFQGTEKKATDFFKLAFQLAANSTPTKSDLNYRSILRMMMFPEAEELCLGYTSTGTKGSGSGKGFSNLITNSIYECIRLGIANLNHFEKLGLFNEGIGCDRISDMTFILLKKEFIDYTVKACKRHNVAMRSFHIDQYSFRSDIQRWDFGKIDLPENPFHPGRAIILTPRAFLRQLPTISADGFLDYCWDNLNQEIRDQLSIHVKSKVNKSDIIKVAKEHLNWVSSFEKSLEKANAAYNITKDPSGLYRWTYQTRDYVNEHPVTFTKASNQSKFPTVRQ